MTENLAGMSTTEPLRSLYLERGWWSESETLQSRIAAVAAIDPERLAAIDAQGRRLSYSELDSQAGRFAAGLAQLGIDRGEVVGMQLPNRVEALTVMCGIERAGGVVALLMPMYRHKEIEYIARTGSMKALVVPGVHRRVDHDGIAVDLRESGLIDHVVSLGDRPGGDPGPAGVVDFWQLVESGASPSWQLPDLRPDDPAALAFTSGTTGAPKGVLHSHNTMLSGNRTLSEALHLTEVDPIFIPAVVGHGTGYVWGMRLALYLGSPAVLMDTWDPERGARLLAAERCSWTMVAPTFVQDLLDAAERAEVDISCLRYLSCGGAAPGTDLHQRVADELDCTLLRLYGQTEAFLSTHCMPGDPPAKLIDTEGAALPGVELEVRNEEGEELPPGEEGELFARGPHRCVGLLTEDGLERLERDRWIASGDLAAIDADGFLSIRGRIKEFINRGGFKYSPVEVENLLHEHPAIARVAVIAVADHRLGERGCACAILRDGAELSFQDLTAYLGSRGMAPFKWPEYLVIREQFPMTPSGKIQKHLLREEVEPGLETQ
jgi:acyl-CoA synthetase (AMP-forming)/AMP-acid ligase II